MSAGKDIEFYLSNASYDNNFSDPVLAGQVKTFEEITNETSTWSNLSADAFSRMNIINQNQALRILAHKNPPAFTRLVNGVLSSQTARSNIKAELLESMEKYGSPATPGGGPDNAYWYDDPKGYNEPKPGELTDFERHAVFEPERPINEFSERPGYPDKTAADWKTAYDNERTKTRENIDQAEQRARRHGKSFFPNN